MTLRDKLGLNSNTIIQEIKNNFERHSVPHCSREKHLFYFEIISRAFSKLEENNEINCRLNNIIKFLGFKSVSNFEMKMRCFCGQTLKLKDVEASMHTLNLDVVLEYLVFKYAKQNNSSSIKREIFKFQTIADKRYDISTESFKNELQQNYYRALVIAAYIKGFNELPNYYSNKNFVQLFGYKTVTTFIKSLDGYRRISSSSAENAAGLLGKKFIKDFPKGHKNRLMNRFNFEIKKLLRQTETEKLSAKFIHQLILRKFSHNEAEVRQRVINKIKLQEKQETYREKKLLKSQLGPYQLKLKTRAPYSLARKKTVVEAQYVEMKINNITAKLTSKAEMNYKKFGLPSDRANQDYFRELIVKAFYKKFNSFLTQHQPKHKAAFFGFRSGFRLWKVLGFGSGKKIKVESAKIAASVLGVDFAPPIRTKDMKLSEIILRFNRIADKNDQRNNRSSNYSKQQAYFRRLILCAYYKEFKTYPQKSSRTIQATRFKFKNFQIMLNSLLGRNRKFIASRSAQKAASYLNVKFLGS